MRFYRYHVYRYHALPWRTEPPARPNEGTFALTRGQATARTPI
jgi:hypothetical protein